MQATRVATLEFGLSALINFCFSSKMDTTVDAKEGVETDVSLVEELQTKLHELEVWHSFQ